MNNSKYIDTLLYILYFILFISLVCAFRAVSSISVAMLLITGIVKNKIDSGSFFSPHLKNNFFLACCIFYFLQIGLIISSQNHDKLERHAELKSAIVLVPLMLCCSNYLTAAVYRKLMQYYVWVLVAAMLFCISTAFHKYYFLNSGSNVFFYHELVGPFNQHAIQVSILIFIGFIFLLESAKKGFYLINKLLHFLIVFYFIACILLLSSKLVIVFTMLGAIYYLLLIFKKIKLRWVAFATLVAGLTMMVFVLSTNNKISKRFNEIIDTKLDLIQQETFDPGIYFDGLQFRLLQWRFVKEILNEKKAWLTGVSDDGQKLLDEKYISTHMYTGDPKIGDRGYLEYNTHNQFLQALLQSGIFGLAAFAFMCLAMIRLVVRRKSRQLFFVVALLLAYSLNEALLERQYSITIFTFFPLFIYFSSEKSIRNPV